MQNERTKMCPNCDGRVSLHVSICPYCGSNFDTNLDVSNTSTKNTIQDNTSSLSYEETLSSLYPPPYKPKVIPTNITPPNENDEGDDKDEYETEDEDEVLDENKKSSLISIVLFWLGVNILIFSIILIVFSKDGALYLKWNTKYWFLYSFLSIPLLYFGFKGLQRLED